MNFKGTTILLVWKVLLNQTVHVHVRLHVKLHVKLFLRGSPVSLPQWFRYGHNCKLTSKIMLGNFPSQLEWQTENFSIFDELRKRQFKKNQVCFSEVIRYALLHRYTSLQSYKLLLDKFPLPSISLLNNIKEGNIDALKAARLLLENGSTSKDLVVLFDEMYLQKRVQYLNIVEESFLVQTLTMSFARVLCALRLLR